jgi:hypothetical protein
MVDGFYGVSECFQISQLLGPPRYLLKIQIPSYTPPGFLHLGGDFEISIFKKELWISGEKPMMNLVMLTKWIKIFLLEKTGAGYASEVHDIIWGCLFVLQCCLELLLGIQTYILEEYSVGSSVILRQNNMYFNTAIQVLLETPTMKMTPWG